MRNSTQKSEVRMDDEASLVMTESLLVSKPNLKASHIQNININSNNQPEIEDPLPKKLTLSKRMKTSVVKIPKDSFLPNISINRSRKTSHRLDCDIFNDTIINYNISNQSYFKTIEDAKQQHLFSKATLHQVQIHNKDISSLNLSSDRLDSESMSNIIQYTPIGMRKERNRISKNYLESNFPTINESYDFNARKLENMNLSTRKNIDALVRKNNTNYGYNNINENSNNDSPFPSFPSINNTKKS